MRLLRVDSSITGEDSGSRLLTSRIVDRWRSTVAEIDVQHLDLAFEPLPHLGSIADPGDEPALSARFLEDFLAADVVVLGAPMYNFTVPSQLKAWIDRILMAGKTFTYTANGPEGLVRGKRVVIAVTCGGIYLRDAAGEHVESFLKHVFNFIGVSDLTFIRAQGLKISPEHRQRSLTAALDSIGEISVAPAPSAHVP